MIKAIIFDMDGVIIDSEPLHFESDRMIMMDFNIRIADDELNKYVGIPNPVMWKELKHKYSLNSSIEEILQKQSSYKRQLLRNTDLQTIPGIRELLCACRQRGIAIGLASSSSRDFIQSVLDGLGITEYFQAVVSGEEVFNGKPAPDIFLRAAELLGIKPSDCIVIEDSSHGVRAARLAKMKCIGFKNPNSGCQDLAEADIVVCSIKEIDLLSL